MFALNNPKLLFIFCIVCWIIGLTANQFYGIELEFQLFPGIPVIDLIVLTIIVFVFSILFFGYLTPILFIAIGLIQGAMFTKEPLSLLMILPIILAGYTGIILGNYLWKELLGEDNLFLHKKALIGYCFPEF